MIDDFVGKKYKLTTNQNFEEFMKATDVNIISRTVYLSSRPVFQLQKVNEDKCYVFIISTGYKNTQFAFKDGEEFDQVALDGSDIKSTITIDGNVLNEVQKGANGEIAIKIKRIFSDSELKEELKYQRTEAIRTYKIVE